MHKTRSIIAACLLMAGVVTSGCATGTAGSDASDLSKVVYSLGTVDNSPEAVDRCNRPAGQGVLMTFDDGGSADQVNAILDKLKQYQMRAAFFPTGMWIEKENNRALVDRMRREGHIVGSHTYSHPYLSRDILSTGNTASFDNEIRPVEGTVNTNPMLFRYPYGDGEYDPAAVERLTGKGIQACTWTFDSRDWDGFSLDQMINLMRNGAERVTDPLGPDGVLLAHMHTPHTPELIDAVVQYLNEKGWAYEHTA